MQSSHNLTFTSTTRLYSMLLAGIGGVVLMLFLFSCSSLPLTQRGILPGEESALSLRYSMVFIIHGDSDYLYHDPQSNARRADQEAFLAATKVAERNPQAEVFIFHERARRHTLVLFPHRDGKFYYYRNGQLLAQESYWRDQGEARFDPEVTLYHRFHMGAQPQAVRFFFYFGHEIPEFGGTGYDASYSQRTFTVPDLADGLKQIASDDSSKFDLLVLSTCFNGTPHTITALAPYARTIIASPDNLHLSYFDLQPFEQLEVGLQDGNVAGFAKKFAQQAFDRLTEDIQTAVTVAIYDVDRVQGYIDSVESVYNQALTSLAGLTTGSIKHCDCADDPVYVLPGMSEGVEVLYRPPRFGRSKQKQIHSGWECWMRLD